MLRGAGLRVTQPRLAVLDALARHPHADTDVIIAAARETRPVSHQAVYDVLHTLADLGLVRRIQPAGSVARYELRVGDNHHHVVCRSCGDVVDIDCATGSAPCLDPSEPTSTRLVSCCTRPRSPTGVSAPRAREPPSRSPTSPHHTALHSPAPRRRGRTVSDQPQSNPSDVTANGSESENPAIDAPTPKPGRPHTNQDWWPNQLDLQVLHQHSPQGQPDGRGLRLRRRVRGARRRGAQAATSSR